MEVMHNPLKTTMPETTEEWVNKQIITTMQDMDKEPITITIVLIHITDTTFDNEFI